MNSNLSFQSALSTPNFVIEVSESFGLIAESLHHALRQISDQATVSTEKAYALITEEYGLRTRLGILRSDAFNRTVQVVGVSQEGLTDLLKQTAIFIKNSRSVEEIAFVVNTVSALCVSIFPGKQKSVDFLIAQLQSDIER